MIKWLKWLFTGRYPLPIPKSGFVNPEPLILTENTDYQTTDKPITYTPEANKTQPFSISEKDKEYYKRAKTFLDWMEKADYEKVFHNYKKMVQEDHVPFEEMKNVAEHWTKMGSFCNIHIDILKPMVDQYLTAHSNNVSEIEWRTQFNIDNPNTTTPQKIPLKLEPFSQEDDLLLTEMAGTLDGIKEYTSFFNNKSWRVTMEYLQDTYAYEPPPEEPVVNET